MKRLGGVESLKQAWKLITLIVTCPLHFHVVAQNLALTNVDAGAINR